MVERRDRAFHCVMPGKLSSGEREFATLVAQLRALEDEIAAARHVSQDVQAGHLHDRHLPRETGSALRGERVTLADGAQIVIRPIEPEDVADLAAGFERLGALSRFRLFGECVDHLTRHQLAELTQRRSRLDRCAGCPRCGDRRGHRRRTLRPCARRSDAGRWHVRGAR
jgi:hypothetical protein